MPTETNFTDPTNNEGDNLRLIHDIGPKFAEALYAIGIRTFAEFAEYSPEDLSAELAEKIGLKVTPERIRSKEWIEQASRLAIVEPTWEQYAGFSVFFDTLIDEHGEQIWQTRVWKTTVYHSETGDEEHFRGVEPGPWVEWILQQAKLPSDTESTSSETTIAAVEQATSQQATIDILDVHIAPRRMTSSQEMKLLATVRFRVTGGDIETPIDVQIPYQIDIQLVDTESGAVIAVPSQQDTLLPGKNEYICQQTFPMIQSGRYEVRSQLLLPSLALNVEHQGQIVNLNY